MRYAVAVYRPAHALRLVRAARRGGVTEWLLVGLCEWRDRTAREEDESLQYVCSDVGLMRIGEGVPRSVGELQGLMNPLPVLVLAYADHVLGLVARCVGE